MLTEIEIRDFAIVREARVELGPGLCVLSGETGAGKSIVIDAIGALMGTRVGPDLVRAGASQARLRAVFELHDHQPARQCLDDLGLPADEPLLIVTREIGGRGRCTVNGTTVTVAMLRRLGEVLVDIHGQHEHQSLLRVAEHRRILDATGGDSLTAALTAFRAAFDPWRAADEAAARLRLDEGEQARRIDALRFQLDEITAARLQPREDEDLLAQRSRLAHAERLLEAAARAHAALDDDGEIPAAESRLATAVDALREMAAYDADAAPLADELSVALATVREAARTLANYADGIDADPRRLDQIEQRLDVLDRLARKYGGSLAAVIAYGEAAAAELDALAHAGDELEASERRIAALAREVGERAAALTAARAATGAALATGVEQQLADLGLAGARFSVALEPLDGPPQADGVDQVEFLFSANPAEPPRPLARIASGGEVSRIMLALKAQLAATDAIPTLVFDEIDVGLGGVTIHNVARKMSTIATQRQVICITHHAPLAARADVHVGLAKQPGADATAVDVHQLGETERVAELARMLGRQPPTEATLAMAHELLAEVAAERQAATD